jgi:hypothetical protein
MTNCDSAQIAEKLGQAAEYVFCSQQWHETLSYKDDVLGSAADFAKAFKEAYGYNASYQAAESAAAVEVFADDFKRAKPRPRQSTRCHRRDGARHVLRSGEVQPFRPGYRQAHGADAGPARQICRGGSRQMGWREARDPAAALLKAAGGALVPAASCGVRASRPRKPSPHTAATPS